MQELAAYNFVIAYCPGVQSAKPDALSRRADFAKGEEPSQVMIPEERFVLAAAQETVTESEIRDLIRKRTPEDTSLEAILAFFGSLNKETPASVKAKFKEYSIENGLLQYQGRIVVPDDSTIK